MVREVAMIHSEYYVNEGLTNMNFRKNKAARNNYEGKIYRVWFQIPQVKFIGRKVKGQNDQFEINWIHEPRSFMYKDT